jgi:AraC family transcriptional regulator
MKNTFHIKNMVCPRCIDTVQNICKDLNIKINSIQLGEVIASTKLSKAQRIEFEEALKARGFELLEDQNSRLINQIKSIIVNQVHHQNETMKFNFSTLLSEQLHHEYTSMSKLFSMVEGITIERFIMKQKVERVKEMLFYDELTLTEIAYKMSYSSVAHLSNQFKKETGMTPSEFKRLRKPGHQSLDQL